MLVSVPFESTQFVIFLSIMNKIGRLAYYVYNTDCFLNNYKNNCKASESLIEFRRTNLT